MIRKSVGFLATAALLSSACVTERVIVMPPNGGTGGQGGSLQVAGNGNPENPVDQGDWGIRGPDAEEYQRVVEKVAAMVGDRNVSMGASRRGLGVMNVMWEDTGRAVGSALGPNISDLTLQVRYRNTSGQAMSALMPVIRFPNFTDRTGDVPADRFFIRVGNEQPGKTPLRTVALTELLKNIKSFASVPDSILGSGDLSAPRDTHFLVSAQAVFLPIPKSGKAEFNPVLFNYQSAPRSPAVLSILVTREGTSVSVIENLPGDASASVGAGQEIYFNNHGQRAAFTAERKSDVEARIAAQGGPKTEDDKSALAKGADVLFLVQVPLVHAQRGVLGGAMPASPPMEAAGAPSKPASKASMADSGEMERSDVEQAVLGHGPNLGPYNEGHNLRLVRDPKFPIRITVQFYKATSNGVVSDADLDGISKSIGSVYEHADFVGSLVLPEDDTRRPTAWQKMPREWFPW
ncbi:MAG: hypothetical protein IPK82_04565 [Polyangiaceae bacterium]|nr:hypothetical protein [Polyangiaceae bacterium]